MANSKPMSGAQGQINRAAGEMPKREAKSSINSGGVGNERKADVRGVQEGGSAAEAARNPLHGAVQELNRQHPHDYTDHGPHHGTSEHIRHAPAVMANSKHPYVRG